LRWRLTLFVAARLGVSGSRDYRRGMPSHRPSPAGETGEGRAFLQARVALFWKVMFFISLLSSGMGAVGAIPQGLTGS
jgi:hypothetical protein